MIESRHTPGPWHYEAFAFGADVCGADGEVIMTSVYENDNGEDITDRTRANVALVATAPEMYEALKGVMDFWQMDANIVANNAQIVEVFDLVKRAIEKAEGSVQ